MYYDKQKVIDWAWSQIGYHEKETNAQQIDELAEVTALQARFQRG